MRNKDVPIVRNKDAGNKTFPSKPKNDTPPGTTPKMYQNPKGRKEERTIPGALIKDKIISVSRLKMQR